QRHSLQRPVFQAGVHGVVPDLFTGAIAHAVTAAALQVQVHAELVPRPHAVRAAHIRHAHVGEVEVGRVVRAGAHGLQVGEVAAPGAAGARVAVVRGQHGELAAVAPVVIGEEGVVQTLCVELGVQGLVVV